LRKKRLFGQLASHLILFVLAVMTLYPFLFMIITSLKINEQFYRNYWWFTFPFHFANYGDVWKLLHKYLYNSLFVTGISVFLIITISAFAAYPFARLRFRLKKTLFMLILSLLMIPGLLTLIPLYTEIRSFGLLNSLWGLILPYTAGGLAFTIFVLRTFFSNIPEDLFEAARMDGARESFIFWSIALPLSKAMLGTLAIMNMLTIWNDYLLPLIVITDPDKFTITIGLFKFMSDIQGQTPQYGTRFAGYVITSAPLLLVFIFTMKYFVRGLTSGAMKM